MAKTDLGVYLDLFGPLDAYIFKGFFESRAVAMLREPREKKADLLLTEVTALINNFFKSNLN